MMLGSLQPPVKDTYGNVNSEPALGAPAKVESNQEKKSQTNQIVAASTEENTTAETTTTTPATATTTIPQDRVAMKPAANVRTRQVHVVLACASTIDCCFKRGYLLCFFFLSFFSIFYDQLYLK
jgi:hypothetical protein